MAFTSTFRPAATDPADGFYVTRFLITCCAVDAQPIGVLVRLPGWQERFAEGRWVRVSGAFAANPDVESPEPVVLTSVTVTGIATPRDPYVY